MSNVRQTVTTPARIHLVPERLCLLIALVFLVVYTLAPFEFSLSQEELLSRTKASLITATPRDVIKFSGHFLSFFIVGVLIAAVDKRSLERRGFGRFVFTAMLFCVGLEVAQLLDPSRHARMTDLLCNAAGLILGTTGSIRWNRLRTLRVALQEYLSRYLVPFQASMLILAAGAWCVAGLRPALGVLNMDWNDTYRLVIANESDGSRPWLGEIRYVGLYNQALTPEQVSFARAHLGSPRKGEAFSGMGLLAGYDFTQAGAKEIHPEGLLRSNLAIRIPEGSEWVEAGGILVQKPSLLVSEEPAFELTKAMASSEAFSIETWIRPLHERQDGPARIVSLSSGIWRRNVTVGQEKTDCILRVRNRITGPNGHKYELYVTGIFQAALQHVVAIYDHGVSSVFIDGRRLAPVKDLREPAVYVMLGTGPWGVAAGALILTVTITLPSHILISLWRPSRRPIVTAGATTLLAGGLPYLLTCLVVGGPWRWNLFFWIAVALLTAYPLGWFYVCHLHAQQRR